MSISHSPSEKLTLADRQNLVDQFNDVVGKSGEAIARQNDFVKGTMHHDESVSYMRFCLYMINEAQKNGTAST